MHRWILLAVLGLLTTVSTGRAIAASSNASMNIAGIMRDGTGSLQSMAVTVTANLYQSASAGTPFHSQTFVDVPVDNGFFSVELSGFSLGGISDTWVGIQVMGDAVELPRQHIAAAPYALS